MKSLLLLDDDDVLRESLKNNLTKFFDSIYEAADIQQALEKIKSYTINFYLLDLNLPDGNGLQLIPTILEHNKNSHIIVLTAYSSIATAVEAIKLGATDYLVKPVFQEDILNAFKFIQTKDKDITLKAVSPKRVEWEHIQKVLKENNYNISSTAKALNMHRRTLQRKLQKKTCELIVKLLRQFVAQIANLITL